MDQYTATDFLPTAKVFSGVHSYLSIFRKKNNNICIAGIRNRNNPVLGDQVYTSEPRKLHPSDLEKFTVKKATSGYHHSLLLTTRGEVFSWGFSEFGQLGLGDKEFHVNPRKVESFFGIFVKDVACGMYSSYCLTKCGAVYSFGENHSGQLGTGNVVNRSSPVPIKIPNDEEIFAISAGYHHVALLSANCVYTFGDGKDGQLGRDGDNLVPMKVEGLPNDENKKIRQVICGGNHTTVIIEKNEIYSFGHNANGRLGLGDDRQRSLPERVIFFDSNPIRKMHIGGGHTVAILESGHIVAYGWNSHHQLFVGDTEDRLEPTRTLSSTIDSKDIMDITCGFWHTLFVTGDGSCYGVGKGIAFGRDGDVSYPKKILENVVLGSEHGRIQEFMKYILDEQNISEEAERTTDIELKIEDKVETHTLQLNKAVLKERFPNDMKLPIVAAQTFTEGMRDQMLKYWYGDVIELDKLSSEEVSGLRDILAENDICRKLRNRCNDYLSDDGDKHMRDEMQGKSQPEPSFEFCMANMFRNREEHGDVTIRTPNGVYKAHKFVLVSRTEYFRSMFRGGFSESLSGDIAIENNFGDTFLLFLQYLYTGETYFLSDASLYDEFMGYMDYFGGDQGNLEL